MNIEGVLDSHIYLGFLMATAALALLCNINWQHFMRYFSGGNPAPSQNFKTLIRIFFLLGFLGISWRLIGALQTDHPTREDLEISLGLGMIILGVYLVINSFFRWVWKKTEIGTG